jgi:betaine lipid synthase
MMDSITGSRAFLFESVRFSSLHFIIFLVAAFVLLFVGLTISAGLARTKGSSESTLVSYSKFFYASFLKPHHSSDGGQQSALESFYETQVCV